MKTQELMLGDLVTFKDSIECDNPPMKIEIVALGFQDGDENTALVRIADDKGCDIIDIDDEVVGIPLTQEILEKNFEKKTFYGIYDDFFDLDIREYSDSIYIVTYHCCEFNMPDETVHVSWVHELQHFFRLCGIEHEIKL